MSQPNSTDNNIKVLLRIRPLNERELEQNSSTCLQQNQNKINLLGSSTKEFEFHFISNIDSTQEEIFSLVGKPMVEKCLQGFFFKKGKYYLQGYNGCIFAYGQTGSGKTYTMQGKGLENNENKETRGLQPHVFDYLFYKANKSKREKQIDFYIKTSYFEIYNEQIIDLLKNSSLNLSVREDIHKGVYVENLSEESVYSSQEMLEILKRGAKNRHVGATRMNFESSRSHSILQMTVETKKNEKGMQQVKASKLYFIDLAGSERQKQTEAIGQRLKEANNINKSLTSLGLVINSLVIKSKHVPYRDSKLTFILRDSLGGNSLTFMIANISPSSLHFSETLSTLNFAQRAKQVTNSAKVNEELNGSVEALKLEIQQLKQQLQEVKELPQNNNNFSEKSRNIFKLSQQQVKQLLKISILL